MQKIIIDTNVLVSALIQKSFPYLILYNCVLDSKVSVCISDELMDEYIDVIYRPKFSRFPDFINKAEIVLAQIDTIALKYKATQKIEIIKDADDNRLLELALVSHSDYLITGNTNDFTMTDFYGTKVVTPKDYWDVYREI